jgi:glycosyltransferase involved in cell wall biosynthesis
MKPFDARTIAESILAFDSEYWTFVNYLALPLYGELTNMLNQSPLQATQRPLISVVVPVYRAHADLLRAAFQSIRSQIGVEVLILASVDGRREDAKLVENVWNEMGGDQENASLRLIFSHDNRGVGVCRNRAFAQIETEVFTCVDSDDLIHPLRSLHGLHLMRHHGVRRVNLSVGRVSIRQRKIFLTHQALQFVSHNSYYALTELFQEYGYQADLRRHEDTEYYRRLEYFNEPMFNSSIASHFLNMEASPEYSSLSTDTHKERFPIAGHPYLCGSIRYGKGEHRHALTEAFRGRYREILAHGLTQAFPPEPPS